jgi:hypothetical protein
MTRIFVSYRRADAPGAAGRLVDRLRSAAGDRNIFLDVTNILPGQDFKQAIRESLARSHYVAVVIGPRWLERDHAGTRRIDEVEDPVRQEIRAALDLHATIVPVLVEGARMPNEQDLPSELRALSVHNAIELRHDHWDGDCARLLEALGGGSCLHRTYRWIGRGRKQKLLAAFYAFSIVALLLAGSLFLALRNVTRGCDLFFELLIRNDTRSAYYSLSEAAQTQSLDQFLEHLHKVKLDRIRAVSWTQFNRVNDQAEVIGTGTLDDGGTLPLVVTLVKERGEWRVLDVRIEAGLPRGARAAR